MAVITHSNANSEPVHNRITIDVFIDPADSALPPSLIDLYDQVQSKGREAADVIVAASTRSGASARVLVNLETIVLQETSATHELGPEV